jgi:hypothetical protein
MDFLRTYAKELFSLLVPIVTATISYVMRLQVRLRYSIPHGFTFLVQEPLRDADGKIVQQTQTMHTQSFFFRNEGRAIAHHVELVFNWKPFCLNIWPIRHYETKTDADGRYVLIFETLAPREYLGCELFSINKQLPNLITFRCDEGIGKKVDMYPQRTLPLWLVRILALMLFVGLAATVYLILIILQWLVLKTPIAL